MRAEAFAKVNLGLRVASRRADGYHPLRSLFLSVSWSDLLEVAPSPEDRFAAIGPEVPAGEDNLAWQAVTAVREVAAAAPPLAVTLEKRIPIAAGLGGGSADAAAALALSGRILGVDDAVLADLAPGIGADVPFCFRGGFAAVGGIGEEIAPLPVPAGFALAIAVPPFRLGTPDVFARWDRLGEPGGRAVASGGLPPSLRDFGPLQNDLFPAAVSLAPELGDWRADLAARWRTPIFMSGSGPALFGLFPTWLEAEDALAEVPGPVRAVFPAIPVSAGWRLDDGTIAERSGPEA
jgi:4-diphosphocytidyl-2-C-methyl-D-erythritol kinase